MLGLNINDKVYKTLIVSTLGLYVFGYGALRLFGVITHYDRGIIIAKHRYSHIVCSSNESKVIDYIYMPLLWIETSYHNGEFVVYSKI